MLDLERFRAFLAVLRAEGFRFGIQEQIRAEWLLLRLCAAAAERPDAAALSGWLAPIFCTTPHEQQVFHQRFRSWIAAPAQPERRAGTSAQAPAGEAPGGPDSAAGSRRGVLAMGAAAAMVALLGLVLWFAVMDGTGPPPGSGVEPSPGPVDDGTPVSPVAGRLPVLRLMERVAVASLPLLGWGVWRWRRQRRQRILARRFVLNPPGSVAFRFRSRAGALFNHERARHDLQSLRLHRSVESAELDVPATVRATIEAGGYASPVHARRPLSPEYLLLAPRMNVRDQLADLAGQLAARMREEQVPVLRFEFGKDPRRLLPADASPGERRLATDLRELAARYPSHRLLLLDDGSSLLDPLGGRPWVWVAEFRAWPACVLLSPVPRDRWGHRERLLAEHGFLVLPADPQGLASLAAMLRGGGGELEGSAALPASPPPGGAYPPSLRLDPARWLARLPPPQARRRRLVAELQRYLGAAGFLWLCACAVFPRLQPELTRHLGARLVDADHRPLMDPEQLMRLGALPWFRLGTLPDWLRRALIERLPGPVERQVRDELQAVLLSHRRGQPGEGFELEIADRSAPGWNRALRELAAAAPAGSPLREQIFLEFMGADDALGVAAPAGLARAVLRRVHPRRLALPLAVVLAVLAFALYPAQGLLGPGVLLAGLADALSLEPGALPWLARISLGLSAVALGHWIWCRCRPRQGPPWPGVVLDGALVLQALVSTLAAVALQSGFPVILGHAAVALLPALVMVLRRWLPAGARAESAAGPQVLAALLDDPFWTVRGLAALVPGLALAGGATAIIGWVDPLDIGGLLWFLILAGPGYVLVWGLMGASLRRPLMTSATVWATLAATGALCFGLAAAVTGTVPVALGHYTAWSDARELWVFGILVINAVLPAFVALVLMPALETRGVPTLRGIQRIALAVGLLAIAALGIFATVLTNDLQNTSEELLVIAVMAIPSLALPLGLLAVPRQRLRQSPLRAVAAVTSVASIPGLLLALAESLNSMVLGGLYLLPSWWPPLLWLAIRGQLRDSRLPARRLLTPRAWAVLLPLFAVRAELGLWGYDLRLYVDIGYLLPLAALWLGRRYGPPALGPVAVGASPMLIDWNITDALAIDGSTGLYLVALAVCKAAGDPAWLERLSARLRLGGGALITVLGVCCTWFAIGAGQFSLVWDPWYLLVAILAFLGALGLATRGLLLLVLILGLVGMAARPLLRAFLSSADEFWLTYLLDDPAAVWTAVAALLIGRWLAGSLMRIDLAELAAPRPVLRSGTLGRGRIRGSRGWFTLPVILALYLHASQSLAARTALPLDFGDVYYNLSTSDALLILLAVAAGIGYGRRGVAIIAAGAVLSGVCLPALAVLAGLPDPVEFRTGELIQLRYRWPDLSDLMVVHLPALAYAWTAHRLTRLP